MFFLAGLLCTGPLSDSLGRAKLYPLRNGGIVALISTSQVVKLEENGFPDLTFGQQGFMKLPIALNVGFQYIAFHLIELAQGNLLASGFNSSHSGLWGFKSNGTIDRSFGFNGVVIERKWLKVGDEYVIPSGFAEQSSGKFLQSFYRGGSTPLAGIHRYAR